MCFMLLKSLGIHRISKDPINPWEGFGAFPIGPPREPKIFIGASDWNETSDSAYLEHFKQLFHLESFKFS